MSPSEPTPPRSCRFGLKLLFRFGFRLLGFSDQFGFALLAFEFSLRFGFSDQLGFARPAFEFSLRFGLNPPVRLLPTEDFGHSRVSAIDRKPGFTPTVRHTRWWQFLLILGVWPAGQSRTVSASWRGRHGFRPN